MTAVEVKPFGKLGQKGQAHLYTVSNEKMAASFTDYGATIVSLLVKDKTGALVDVVLGYDDVESYAQGSAFFGATIGRCANRIAHATFELDGETFTLAQNDGKNHLHGGIEGFDTCFWSAEIQNDGVRFYRMSKDGEEGYPGNLAVSVTYTLVDDALHIVHEAKTDKPTLCNLCNHAYFNLDGHASGNVDEQVIKICASEFCPTDETSIPTGEIKAVEDTPFDFRTPKAIGKDISNPDEQLMRAQGYDHNWVLQDKSSGLHEVAFAYAAHSGIALQVESTQPGVQFYSGNYIDSNGPLGKGGAVYDVRGGFCLETQAFPDSIHHESFSNVILWPNETYRAETLYRFTLK